MTSIISTNIADSVRRMDGTSRFMALASIIGAGIAVWFIVSWAITPTFVPLYPGQVLTLAEVSAITSRLEAEDIPVTSEGGIVRVPADRVERVRINLAAENLGLGACANDTEFSIGAGALERKIKELQSIRSQLECTISGMNAVEKVRVSLTLPEGPSFLNRQPPKAAVTIWPRRNAPFTAQMVASITYLVSGAVPELTPDQVAVLDGVTARPLNVPGDADASPVSRSIRELDARRQVEQHLISKVEEILVPILPPREFQVQVSAELDWTALQRTSEAFDPNAQAIVREESNEVPPGAIGPGSPAFNSAESESRYSRTVESITNSPGSISRLTVAVSVNERASVFGGGPDVPPDPGLLAQQTSRIEAIVQNAVALDPSRGDVIVVHALPFWNGEQVDAISLEPAPSIDVVNLTQQLIRPVVGLLGIAAVVLLALKVSQRRPGPARALSPGESAASALQRGRTAPEVDGQTPNPMVEASLRLQQQVASEAEKNPDTTARVIQAWLTEPAA